MRQAPCCFLAANRAWIVGGYLDGSLKLVNCDSGKVDGSLVPTGDVITSVNCTKGILAAGTANGDVLVWASFAMGADSKMKKVSGYLDFPVTNLKFVEKTPLLLAGTERGELLLVNYSDLKPLQKIVHPSNFPIEKVTYFQIR